MPHQIPFDMAEIETNDRTQCWDERMIVVVVVVVLILISIAQDLHNWTFPKCTLFQNNFNQWRTMYVVRATVIPIEDGEKFWFYFFTFWTTE